MSVPEFSASFGAPGCSDIPVCLLGVGLDVQTQRFLAETVAKDLQNATHVIFPCGFHRQIANMRKCAQSIFRAFIDKPSVALDM